MRGVSLTSWGLSLLLHLGLLIVLVVFWPVNSPPPPAVSLHFESGPAPSGGTSGRSELPHPQPPQVPTDSLAKPKAHVQWKGLTQTTSRNVQPQATLSPPAFPDEEASAEDLLGDQSPPHQKVSQLWQSGGGSAPPIYPPVPPQNVPSGEITWHLTLWIPPQGGVPEKILGLETAHPLLDTWLGAWLAKQGFPASETGKSYQIHWILTLKSVSPN